MWLCGFLDWQRDDGKASEALSDSGQPMPNGKGGFMTFGDGYLIAFVFLSFSVGWLIAARRFWRQK